MKHILLAVAILCASCTAAFPAGNEKEQERVKDSGVVLKEILNIPDNIPQNLLDKAECLVILPSVKRAAFGFGASYGRGVMVCRSGEHYTGPWGPPALYALEGGSIGFQLGVEGTDFVLLVMNSKGARSLLSSKVKLGADASVAAGPKGRTFEGATDIVMSAEILSYSRNKGLFAGISLEGSTLRADGSANEKLYGQKLSAKDIIRGDKVQNPSCAAELVALLDKESPENLSDPKSLPTADLAAGQSAQPEVQTEPLKADDIMARVAANQDRSEAARMEYVYKQHIHIATHKPKSRMMREENADYDVVPLPDGTIQKQLKSLAGRYWDKANNKYVDFQGEPLPDAGRTDADLIGSLRNHEPLPEAGRTDADLIRNLRNHLLNDNSKDGLARDLFPLTSEEQKEYEFKLLAQEVEAGRNVYHIAFAPKNTAGPMWAGQAFIDAAEFQPVRVFTKMSQSLPFLVRTMWFDLPGLGFDVEYERQQDGVWFPSSFGTEFGVHVGPLFFFDRDISISLTNSEFDHKHVESK